MRSFVSPLSGAVRRFDSAPAEFEISPDEPVFEGHYPEFAIFPGVCIVESAHHAALGSAPDGADRLVLHAIESARFLSPAFPGDRLSIDTSWSATAEGWRCNAQVATTRGRAASIRLVYRSGGSQ